MTDRRRKILLSLEYATLFVALPLFFYFRILPVPIILVLWLLAAGCLMVLSRSRGFERRRLWTAPSGASWIVPVLAPFLLAAIPLALLTWRLDPGRLFGFVRQRPLLWVVVMLLYPLLSAYPQGIVYRVFVFHRYRALFPHRWSRILASAVAFSLAHVVFQNWIAPPLAFVGGLLFAWTYERWSSSLVATAQHALFGCYLFTIGLGWYFYYGSVP